MILGADVITSVILDASNLEPEATMQALKLIQIGNSVGVVLPKEILAQLDVDKGDSLFFSATPNGVRITATNPEFEAQMTAARGIMKKRRNVLAELAK